MGPRIHHPPAEDRDEEGFYNFSVFDPDGIRVEICSWTDEGRARWAARHWRDAGLDTEWGQAIVQEQLAGSERST